MYFFSNICYIYIYTDMHTHTLSEKKTDQKKDLQDQPLH